MHEEPTVETLWGKDNHSRNKWEPNVVAFHNTASTVLHEFHSQKNKDPEQEKAQIIKTATQLIKNDIKAIKQSKDMYPSNAERASR